MKWDISIQDAENGATGHFAMEGLQVRIGRLPNLNDLSIPHPEISRQHAVLSLQDGIVQLEDLDSKNGSFVLDESGNWRKLAYRGCLILPASVRLGRRVTLTIRVGIQSEKVRGEDISAIPSAHPVMQADQGETIQILEMGTMTSPTVEERPGTNEALVVGTVLHRYYRIEAVLGRGSFGITYLGQDDKLNRLVAIKEYFCQEFAVRKENQWVRPARGMKDLFAWGLSRFAEEGKILAQLHHPNLVQILNYFEANGTAYLVMAYEEGRNLESLLSAQQTFDQESVLRILEPLLGSLTAIHDAKQIHRDIKPANIVLRQDGLPVLLDFGAARQLSHGTTGQSIQRITSLFSPGYTPFEQYTTEAKLQGPWSDIYALSAVIYHLITGKSPSDAQTRMAYHLNGDKDPYRPLVKMAPKGYSARFLRAIDQGLALEPAQRPQDIASWRCLLAESSSGAAGHLVGNAIPAFWQDHGTSLQFIGSAMAGLMLGLLVITGIERWSAPESEDHRAELAVMSKRLESPPKEPMVQAVNGVLEIHPWHDLHWQSGPPSWIAEAEDSHGTPLTSTPSLPWRKEPHYRASKIYYGSLPIAARRGESPIGFALDGVGLPPWQLYLDYNNNGDLTDDGLPVSTNQPGRLEATIRLPNRGGYTLGLVITSTQDGGLRAFFRAKGHLAGKVLLDGQSFPVAAYETTQPTGQFREGLLIDLNQEGRFDPKAGRFRNQELIPIGSQRYRLVMVDP